MFWGLRLEEGKNYSQLVDYSFHISQATLDPQRHNGGSDFTASLVAVHAVVDDVDYILCYLGKVVPDSQSPIYVQQSLNLDITEGETITLYISTVFGDEDCTNTVHLTGYFNGAYEYANVEAEDVVAAEAVHEEDSFGSLKVQLFPGGEEEKESPAKKRKREGEDGESKENVSEAEVPTAKARKRKRGGKKAEVNDDAVKKKEKISVFTTNGGTEVQEVKEGSGRIAKPGKMVQK